MPVQQMREKIQNQEFRVKMSSSIMFMIIDRFRFDSGYGFRARIPNPIHKHTNIYVHIVTYIKVM
jgi:hypothetical protein